MKIKGFLKKYSHAWVFLYWLIYLPWFGWLERTVTSNYHVLESTWDKYIPFCEGFIIPYLLWFPYVALVITWFFFKEDRKSFYEMTAYLYAGMTIFLVFCTLYPNGLNLRPQVIPRDNIFVDMVKAIWAVDTPTNVLPSLHVFNSVACCAAVLRSEKLRRFRWVSVGTVALTVSICLATMFLKQHSVIDVVMALFMAFVLYHAIYSPVRVTKFSTVKSRT